MATADRLRSSTDRLPGVDRQTMIVPRELPGPESVAGHYEELDAFYRDIWGEHVHHGFWRTGKESVEQAVLNLSAYVAEIACIKPGQTVCDIGSGYGATARMLAAHYAAQVTALTVTPRQHQYAVSIEPGSTNPVYLLRDWQYNGLASGAFDAAIAIESTDHMADKQRALREMARVLKPGGRVALCVWLARDAPRRWEEQYLLEPICREGRLFGMATESEYRDLLEAVGLKVHLFADLSRHVQRTWSICTHRVLRALWRRPDYRHYLRNPRNQNRLFAWTMIRIRLAYATGAMRYGVFAASRG
ncbi:MAG: methyltransferase domain-containing protein [Gammaproteobacteria bacterium]|nr:methyltransferase domain-containing protein [Gammaproteobacteria bacterium]MCI0590466.1 methyltransferase domain-containing protein [Gammaproteobacteria bacterium]